MCIRDRSCIAPALTQRTVAGAGSLLLLAAAHETGLITTLQATLTPLLPTAAPRLARLRAATLRALLLTVLWGVMAGLARPWALRTYTGQLGLNARPPETL